MAMHVCLRAMVTKHSDWINTCPDKLHPVDTEFSGIEKAVTTHFATPDFPLQNFEYKAYAGTIFTRLRYHYSIPDAVYLNSVAGEQGYADFIANSKSSSFFFYTFDGAYMIKSMTQDEVSFLRLHLLRRYYSHLIAHIDSLLIKIFGLYRIVKNGRKTYFMVMKNVFFGDKPIHVRFDLKGSTYGRSAKEKEKEQETPVLKDIEFINGTTVHGVQLDPMYLRLGIKKQALVAMLTKDVNVLCELGIIDYSLLVGVHYRDRVKDRTSRRTSFTVDNVSLNGVSSNTEEHGSDFQMNYGTKKHEVIIPRALIQSVDKKIEANTTHERRKSDIA